MNWLEVQGKLREIEASLALVNSATRRTLDERAIRLALKEWDESLHPRNERGEFSEGGGGGAGESLLTHEQAWQATRERLDTSSLDGAHSNAIDPPNLSAATAEQRMLDLYNRSVAQGHAAEDANWYIDKHNEIGQWADNLNVPRQNFTDAVAATSPLTAWNLPNSPRLPNLEAARAMVGAEAAHPNLSAQEIRAITPHTGGYPFIGQSAENAVRSLRGDNPDEVFNAPKIRSFNNNLSHPEHPFDVTVDTHMGRAMLDAHEKTPEAKAAVDTLIKGTKVGRGPTAQTVGGYGWAADRIRGAAATAGVHPPSAFQAVVWEQWRREGGALTTSRAAKMQTDADFDDENPDLTDEEVAALWKDVADWADAGAHSDWKVPNHQALKAASEARLRYILARFDAEEKFNPYHDERGRFTNEGGGTFVSLFGKPSEAGRVVGPGKELPPERAARGPQSHAELTQALAGLHQQSQDNARAVRDAADELANARTARDDARKAANEAGEHLRQTNSDLNQSLTGRAYAEGKGEPKEVLDELDQGIKDVTAERDQARIDYGLANKANDAAESRVFKATDALNAATAKAEQDSAKALSTRDGLNDQLRQNMIAESDQRSAAIKTGMAANQAVYDKAGEDYQKVADQWGAARGQVEMASRALDQARNMYEPSDPEIAQRQSELDAARTQMNRAQDNVDKASLTLDDASTKFWSAQHGFQAERNNLNDALRAKYINAPEGPSTLTMTPTVLERDASGYPVATPMAAADVPKSWGEGSGIAQEIVGKGAVNEASSGRAGGQIPFHPMQPGDPNSRNGRSYCNYQQGVTMAPGTENSTWTAVHETAHYMEDAIPGMYQRVQEHIASRTQGETYQSLSKLTGAGYDSDEVAKPDSFADAYMGKDYGGRADEFISMSVQKMYEDPIGFAKTDPQSYNFTMGLFQEARANGGFVQPSAKQASV